MKKWIVAVMAIIILIMGMIGLFLKVKMDIESINGSRYAVLFLDDENTVDFIVAGDINMFDDIENNAVDNKLEKDGVSIYDAINQFGSREGSARVKEILKDRNITVDQIVLVKDRIIELIYPEEKTDISGTIFPFELKKDEVISLYRGQINLIRLPVESPHGIFYTDYTNITREELKDLPMSFQITLKDTQTEKPHNIFISGNDLETLCVKGVLSKTFLIKYSIIDIYGNIIPIVIKIPATVTLEDIATYRLNDTLTLNRSLYYKVEVGTEKMIAILRDAKDIDIDVLGNYKTKAWILNRFPKKDVDKDLMLEIIKVYEKGDIQIYPSNLTLTLIKFIPDSMVEFLIDKFLS